MNKQELIDKINEAMENVLIKYYDDEDITTGDIDPLQILEWDGLIEKMADLFIELANVNRK